VLCGRVGRLPAPSRALLLLAALEGTGDLGLLVAAATRSGVLDGLPALEQSRLVSVDEHGRRLEFPHPLARDAVVDMSTAIERRRAHRILARALADQPDRRAWHLAEATAAPDEQVAALLERTAQASLRRGDAPGAVRALARAAELSPRRPDRGRRLAEAACAAATHALVSGLADDQVTGQRDVAPAGTAIALRQEPPGAGTARLTPQELEIATLAASGLSNKQIAERLYLSHRTVSFHLHRAFPKLGIASRAALRAAL
jgi:DNA-binding CsgD family transcriptional regulator